MRLIPLILLSLLAGCSTYNFDLVQPESSRARITAADWQRVAAGPVSYRFRAMENHLIVQIYNTTADPVRLLGDRSYLVTPDNQSLPIQSQSIAPGSFVKLILPPVEQITRPGPTIGIGLGYTTGRADDAGLPEPVYFSDSPVPYWEWAGETDVTLHLAFEQPGEKPLEQTFVFHRVKV